MNNDEQLAAFKAAMGPQIDEALAGFFANITKTCETVAHAEIDHCIKIVEACRAPAGKLSEQSTMIWNKAIEFAAEGLRSWKAAGPTPSPTSREGGA